MRGPHSSIGVVVPFALLEMGSLMVVIMFTILLEGVKDGNAAFKGKVVPLANAHLNSVALSLGISLIFKEFYSSPLLSSPRFVLVSLNSL